MKLIYRTRLSQLQRGFQLMEMIIVLTALVGLMGMFSKHLQRELQQAANQAVAHQLRQVTRAAYQYAQDNYLSLSNPSPSITLKKLLDDGYLSRHLPEKNLYDQEYTIDVIQSDPAVPLKSLQILVTTTGGRAINEDAIRKIAKKVGGNGGYSSITMPGKVIGSAGGWEINAPGIKDGHLASLTVVNEKDVMANYYVSNGEEDLLHRVKVDGHPEYNKMETDLEMAQDKKISFAGTDGKSGTEIEKDKIHYMNPNGSNFSLENDVYGGTLTITNNVGNVITSSVIGHNTFKSTGTYGELTTKIKPAVVELEDKPKGEKAYLSNNTIWLKNRTNTTEITPTKINTGEIFADKLKIEVSEDEYSGVNFHQPQGLAEDLSKRGFVASQDGVSIPYFRVKDVNRDGLLLTKKICAKNGRGGMFILEAFNGFIPSELVRQDVHGTQTTKSGYSSGLVICATPGVALTDSRTIASFIPVVSVAIDNSLINSSNSMLWKPVRITPWP